MPTNGDAKLDAAEIESKRFSSGFRGYDQTEVRQYLKSLSNQVRSGAADSGDTEAETQRLVDQLEELERELASANERMAELAAEPAAANPSAMTDMDEDEVTALLGEETARVLTSARRAAADIVKRAEDRAEAIEEEAARRKAEAEAEAEDLVSSATSKAQETTDSATAQAAELRSAAEAKATAKTEEAHQTATQIVEKAEATAETLRSEAERDAELTRQASDDAKTAANEAAEAIRAEAEADSVASADAAREHTRQMLVEAQSVREKVLSDLVVKRRVARQQLDGVKAARDRLARSLFEVRAQVDRAATELDLAVPEARLALESFTRRKDASTDQSDVVKLERRLDEQSDPIESEPETVEPEVIEPESEAVEPEVVEPEPEAIEPEPEAVEPEEPDESEVVEPEPEAVEPEAVEPEPEVIEREAEATEPEPEAVEPDESHHSLDDLFAEIRSSRRDDIETSPGVIPLAEPEAEPVESAATDDADDLDDAEPKDGTQPEARSEFLDRDVALTRLGPDVRRLVKRAFADDLSDILDRIRSGKGQPSVEELAPKEKLSLAVRDALEGGLSKAAERGAALGGRGGEVEVGSLVDRLTEELVDPFRNRVESIVGRSVADREDLLDPLRAAYREVRSNELGSIADDGLAEAFAYGIYASIEDGTPVRWVTDPRASTGAECHDNTLAGPVTKGDEFPTGHRHPTVERGCRCLVLPA